MQSIGVQMNNAASVVAEGKNSMQKDLGRGGRKAMAWLALLVIGFSMLVKVFDSVFFGEDNSGIGEISLFAAFVIGIVLSRLNVNWRDEAAKFLQPFKQQMKRGVESPQLESASTLKSTAKTKKNSAQAQKGGRNGASAGISGTSSASAPGRANAQRRGNNTTGGTGKSWAAEAMALRDRSISVETVQCMLDSGSEIEVRILVQGIAACCEARNLELAETWVEQLLRLTPSALKSISMALVHMLCESGIRAGGARKVAAWLGQLHAGGIPCHSKTLLSVLDSLVAINEVARAEQLLSRMEAADAHVDTACYQLLFEHCVPLESTENVARAEMWLKRIGRRGTAQLAQGYAALIRARGDPIIGQLAESPEEELKAEVNRAKQVEFWMNHALAAGVTRSTQCYNSVIHAFTKAGDIDKAEIWLERMEKAAKEAAEDQTSESSKGFGPDVYSYSTLMDAYAQQGNTAKAEACFARMKPAGVRPDAVSFNTLVKAHARSGSMSGAEQWLMRARRHAVKVDAYGYNAVIAAAARNGDPTAAESWLCRMHEDGACPDVVSYNSVINAWAKRSDAQSALRLINMMCENEVEPDVVTLGAALHACAKAGELSLAEGIFKRIVARGNAKPDAICYNAMIDAFVKANDTQKAEKWLSAMVSDGVPPSVVSYTTVLHAHARAGDIEAAERGMELMLANGIEANVVSFSALIHACVKAGDIERGEKWFERMRAAGVQPNAISYSVLLNVCAKAGDVSRAERWMEDMCAAGIQPNVVCYNNVIDACAKAGRGEQAEAWLRRLIEASRAQKAEGPANRNAQVGHSGGHGRGGKFVPEGDLAPTRQSFTTAAQAYATHGLWIDVERIFTEMEETGLSTDEFSLTVMLSAYARGRPRQRERAELAFRRHIARGLRVSKPPLRVLRSLVGGPRCEQLLKDLQVKLPGGTLAD